MSLSDLTHAKNVAKTTTQYLIVWTALLVWDSLSTLPAERRLIWKRDWTLLKVVFLLNRYGTLILEIASATIILTPMSQGQCNRVYWIQPLTIVFAIIVCSTITSIRIFAIYERQRKIGCLLATLITIQAIGCIAASTQIDPLNLPVPIAELLELKGCLVVAKPGRSGKFVLAIAVLPITFDTIILCLALLRSLSVRREFGVDIPILTRVVRDGVLYYLAITATHVVTTIFWFQNDITIKSFGVPSSIVVPSLMCSRLILSLLSRNQRPRPVQALPDFPITPGGGGDNEETGPGERGTRKVPISLGDRLVVKPVGGETSQEASGMANDSTKTSPPPALPPQASTPPFLAVSQPVVAHRTLVPFPISHPLLASRPSLHSRKSEATLDSIKSRRSQGSASEVPILAIQVTKETVVSVAVEDEDHSSSSLPVAGGRSSRSSPLTTPRNSRE